MSGDNPANTARDTASYDCCSYQRGGSPLVDANALYRGFRKSQKGSAWKETVQRFELDYLSQIAKLQRDMQERKYKRSAYTTFVLRERGKTRFITGEHVRDRTLKHTLCDDILTPTVTPYLIHDNGASTPGKGIGFTRQRLVTHLTKYYRQCRNSGYILLMDFSKFYDNIRHKELKETLFKHVDDKTAEYLIDEILENERIDVSYMAPEEYANCMDAVFNSLEYQNIPQHLKTKKLYMGKHLDIGDQLAQVAGIVYPSDLDNYIKIVRGIKFYARYMDDSYILHPDKEYLKQILNDIIIYAKKLGITVNEAKTRIVPISSKWRFLQVQYSLTDTGRIIHKVNSKAVTRCRRKLKKLANILPPNDFKIWFNSWYGANNKYMSKLQCQNLLKLFLELEESSCIK